jgi:Uma2 family endonuclease
MGVVTMTESLMHPEFGRPWTIDDLARLPDDDGMRYEIVDGSLLVSPHANVYHFGVAGLLARLLDRQAPDQFLVAQDGSVQVKNRTSYFLPDVMAVRRDAIQRGRDCFDPADVPLVIEVLSPSNRGNDLIIKRHYYAAGGIPQYWIVDPEKRTLTVLTLEGDSYQDRAVVEAGQVWRSDEPFPLTIDPADVL